METENPQWPSAADEKTDAGIAAPDPQAEHDTGPSRMARAGIWAFAVAAFFFFLVMKLPEARIQNLVIAHIRIIAQEQGFAFSAERVRVGMLLGPSLKMYNVELKALDNERQSLKIPYLKIKPRLFSLLTSVKKVGIVAELLEGDLSGYVGASKDGALAVDLDLDDLDLGSTTALKKFLPVDLAARLNGRVRLFTDPIDVQKTEGELRLKIDKLGLPAQTLYGFNLPKLTVSEGRINVTASGGKLSINEFEIGKEGSADDIVGKVTGEGTLNKYLDRSTVSAKASFALSQSIKKALPFLESIIASAKQADGKYAYRIGGTLSALEPVPGQ